MNNLTNKNEPTQEDYQRLLSFFVKRINDNKYEYKQGGEGFAYIVDDEFVVKEYQIVSGSCPEYLYETYFEKYCEEMKAFAESGLPVPKFYAWCKQPLTGKRLTSSYPVTSYYILEERAKGRELYYFSLEEFYAEFVEDMKFDEYQCLLRHYDDPACEKIYTKFASDYMFINKCIESLPESEIEKFLMGIYNIYISGQYGRPDLYSSNVFMNNQNLTLIDQRFVHQEKDKNELIKARGDFFLKSIVSMFVFNTMPRSYFDTAKSEAKNLKYLDMFDIILQNEKDCTAAIKKFIKVLNKCLDRPKFTSKITQSEFFYNLVPIVGKENSNKILSEIAKNEML